MMNATERPRCSICGGNAGQLLDGAHCLCAAFKKLGLPTPSLGDACSKCHGVKCLPRGPVGPINPSGETLHRWAPPCDHCNATGVEPGTKQEP